MNFKKIDTKKVVLNILFLLTAMFGFSQNETKGITLTVSVDNVKNDIGLVLMTLHSSETFMKSNGLKNAKSVIKDGSVTIVFENVLPGEYAIMALHDENENQRMDFDNNGMPKESYGMSNNSMSFGPPQYEDAKFKVETKNLEINIRF